MPYCDKYIFNNNKNHTISQNSHNIKKNVIFFIFIHQATNIDKYINANHKIGESQILEIVN